MPKYQLVNPYIEGEFETEYNTKSVEDAATNAWKSLSKYMVPHLRRFGFTMMGSNNKLHHFVVAEKMQNGVADFGLKEVNPKLTEKEVQNFLSKLSGLKKGTVQSGGRRARFDDEDKDDDLNEFMEDVFDDLEDDGDMLGLIKNNKVNWLYQPIQYVWYDPYMYHVDWISFPTFVSPLTPVVEIALTTPYYYWKFN